MCRTIWSDYGGAAYDAEFLRIDFPRIPFPEHKVNFEALSALGWELVQAHLLKNLPPLKLAELDGKGNDMVEAVR